MLDGTRLVVAAEPGPGGRMAVKVEGETEGGPARRIEATLVREEPGELVLSLGGRAVRARFVHAGRELLVAVGGETYRFGPVDRVGGGRGKGRHGHVDGRISAPMPGAVVQVLVTEGAPVAAGTDLLVVEAMKMEHRLRAPFAGTVRKLRALVGQRCALGEVLLEIEAPAPA